MKGGSGMVWLREEGTGRRGCRRDGWPAMGARALSRAVMPVAISAAILAAILATAGGLHADGQAAAASERAPRTAAAGTGTAAGGYLGFDRNEYPGDQAMAALHRSFAFTGYWLTNPPGEDSNTWQGKREALLRQGWGFLVLANGRLDAEISKAQRRGITPAALARRDAAAAVARARAEGFPAHTILFLDQEEGGELLAEQAAYLLAWTEDVAGSEYRPGVYASGAPVFVRSGSPVPVGTPAGAGQTTTIDDIRSRVLAKGLHPVAMFDAQDACPPAPGCTLKARPLESSGMAVLSPGGDLAAWQYAQSPRRPELTRACAATYDRDGNCYAPEAPGVFLDMDLAASADPSHGR